MFVWITVAAHAGTVRNDRTGVVSPTVSAAIAAATPGDVLELTGSFSEQVVLDRDLTLVDPTGTAVISSSAPSGAVVRLEPSVQAVIAGVSVTSATVRAIEATDGNVLTLRDLTLQGDTSGSGGAVTSTNLSGLTMERVTVDGAHADLGGGGLSLTGNGATPVVLTDVSFVGTTANGNGGALATNDVSLSCVRCSFSGTSAANGGAVFDVNGSALSFVDSAFSGTSATVAGGAIHVGSQTPGLAVLRSTFCGSNATLGGAVYGAAQTGDVRNSVFSGASASAGTGAALHLLGGSWTVAFDDVVGSVSGNGISVLGATVVVDSVLIFDNAETGIDRGAGSVTVRNTTLWANAVDLDGTIALSQAQFVDPLVRSWTPDGDCGDDVLAPRWDSPLIGTGNLTARDPDNSRADAGFTGGPDADPAYHDDVDGDGYTWTLECDDDHAAAHPGHDELCDALDNDCDGVVNDDPVDLDQWYRDCDGDDQGDPASRIDACFEPTVGACPWLSEAAWGPSAWGDCNDSDDTVFFGADELCRAGDQDCDGDPDRGAVDALTYWEDLDGDTWGSDVEVASCVANPPDTAPRTGDCDDARPPIHPGASDTCGDQIDADCNGGDGDDSTIDDWFPDTDGDGYGDPDGAVLLDCNDLSGTGYSLDATDCDDGLAAVNPGASEVCNLVDDDCDRTIDDVGTPRTWYEDADGDTYGNEALPLTDDCAPDASWVEDGTDCDDGEATVNPGASEVCNGVDDDCDDLLDAVDGASDAVGVWPDGDGDGYGACDDGSSTCDAELVCPDELDAGWADNADDCDDGLADVSPGETEVEGNDVDEDCDGTAQGQGGEPPPDDEEDTGCGCDQGSVPVAPLALLPLVLVARRRRVSA